MEMRGAVVREVSPTQKEHEDICPRQAVNALHIHESIRVLFTSHMLQGRHCESQQNNFDVGRGPNDGLDPVSRCPLRRPRLYPPGRACSPLPPPLAHAALWESLLVL